MAVGVPETEVFAAADRVLARGERPTVERVRAELGRGSPARVGQLLETWWEALAKRLAGHTQLPAVPPDVASAFTHAWEVALAAGQVHAEALVAPERAALADVIARADAVVASERLAREAAEDAAQMAHGAQRHAEARVCDLARLTEVQAQQLDELRAEMAALRDQLGRREQEVTASRSALDTQRAEAADERARLVAHATAVENRAHVEVDRVRQDLKASQTALTRSTREADTQRRALERQLEASRSAQRTIERQLAQTLAAANRSKLPKGRAPKPPAASAKSHPAGARASRAPR